MQVMASHGYGFCFLVLMLVFMSRLADCAGRSRLGLTSGHIAMDPSTDGICASSVVIHGYKCQEIEVTTQDGFILSVQRIPQGRVGGGDTKRQPVLIQHGVLVDGMSWLLNPPEQNLPMILADQGFDVWIANTRGTRFSKSHTSLQPTQKAFWDWSWDELVSFDLPAVFDYVYSQTGQKMHYVGHSLGTLIAFASMAEGLLADKLKSAALLSPIAYLSHMNTALGVIAARSFVGEITTLFGLAEFNPKGEAVAQFLKALCAYPGVDCYDYLIAITGMNCCLNASTVNLFLKNEPQSTATKNMIHLAQTVRDGVIAKYNYGNPDYNVMHYGEAKPPVYNLSNIPSDIPIFISYGGKDALSDVRDVQLLLDNLKFHDVDKLTIQYIKDYAHADFIMGVNAKDIVYNQVVSFFKHHFYIDTEHNETVQCLFVGFGLCFSYCKKGLGSSACCWGKQAWDESTDFKSWSSGQKFKVGDQLAFKYSSELHSVMELGSEAAYNNCDLGTAVNSMNTGNDVVKLDKPGTRYFACCTLGHCDQGMKVKITTEGSGGTAPSTPASSTSSSAAPSASTVAPSGFFVLLVSALLATCFVM